MEFTLCSSLLHCLNAKQKIKYFCTIIIWKTFTSLPVMKAPRRTSNEYSTKPLLLFVFLNYYLKTNVTMVGIWKLNDYLWVEYRYLYGRNIVTRRVEHIFADDNRQLIKIITFNLKTTIGLVPIAFVLRIARLKRNNGCLMVREDDSFHLMYSVEFDF